MNTYNEQIGDVHCVLSASLLHKILTKGIDKTIRKWYLHANELHSVNIFHAACTDEENGELSSCPVTYFWPSRGAAFNGFKDYRGYLLDILDSDKKTILSSKIESIAKLSNNASVLKLECGFFKFNLNRLLPNAQKFIKSFVQFRDLKAVRLIIQNDNENYGFLEEMSGLTWSNRKGNSTRADCIILKTGISVLSWINKMNAFLYTEAGNRLQDSLTTYKKQKISDEHFAEKTEKFIEFIGSIVQDSANLQKLYLEYQESVYMHPATPKFQLSTSDLFHTFIEIPLAQSAMLLTQPESLKFKNIKEISAHFSERVRTVEPESISKIYNEMQECIIALLIQSMKPCYSIIPEVSISVIGRAGWGRRCALPNRKVKLLFITELPKDQITGSMNKFIELFKTQCESVGIQLSLPILYGQPIELFKYYMDWTEVNYDEAGKRRSTKLSEEHQLIQLCGIWETEYLFGNRQLATSFKTTVSAIVQSKDELTMQPRSQQYVQSLLNYVKKTLDSIQYVKESRGSSLDVHQLTVNLSKFLNFLAIYYNVERSDPWNRMEEFRKLHILEDEIFDQILCVLNIALTIELHSHFFYSSYGASQDKCLVYSPATLTVSTDKKQEPASNKKKYILENRSYWNILSYFHNTSFRKFGIRLFEFALWLDDSTTTGSQNPLLIPSADYSVHIFAFYRTQAEKYLNDKIMHWKIVKYYGEAAKCYRDHHPPIAQEKQTVMHDQTNQELSIDALIDISAVCVSKENFIFSKIDEMLRILIASTNFNQIRYDKLHNSMYIADVTVNAFLKFSISRSLLRPRYKSDTTVIYSIYNSFIAAILDTCNKLHRNITISHSLLVFIAKAIFILIIHKSSISTFHTLWYQLLQSTAYLQVLIEFVALAASQIEHATKVHTGVDVFDTTTIKQILLYLPLNRSGERLVLEDHMNQLHSILFSISDPILGPDTDENGGRILSHFTSMLNNESLNIDQSEPDSVTIEWITMIRKLKATSVISDYQSILQKKEPATLQLRSTATAPPGSYILDKSNITSISTLGATFRTEISKYKRKLKKQFIQQLFTDDFSNHPSAIEEPDSRVKIPLKMDGKVLGYVKVEPYKPTVQRAIDLFSYKLSGAACGKVLAKITTNPSNQRFRAQSIPVLLTKPLEGYPLHEILNTELLEQVCKSLNPFYFTLKVIECLLINSDDNSTNNIFLEKMHKSGYRIITVASENVFSESVRDKNNFIKSAIYCFEQMKCKLDQDAVNLFLEYDSFEFIESWLTLLNEEENYTSSEHLFDPELIKQFARSQKALKTNIPLEFQTRTAVYTMYHRFNRIQHFLRKDKELATPELTHSQLFAALDPKLFCYYSDLLNLPSLRERWKTLIFCAMVAERTTSAPPVLQSDSPESSRKHLFVKKDLTKLKSLQMSTDFIQGKSKDQEMPVICENYKISEYLTDFKTMRHLLQDVEKRKQHLLTGNIQEAFSELINLPPNSLHTAAASGAAITLNSTNPITSTIVEKIFRGFDWSIFYKEKENNVNHSSVELLFKIYASVSNLQILEFKNAASFDDVLLKKFVKSSSSSLSVLDLSGTKVSSASILTVAKFTQNLVDLRLNSLSWTYFDQPSYRFMYLRKLVMNNCPKLEKVTINMKYTPSLERLSIEHCPELATFTLKANLSDNPQCFLEYISFRGDSSLSFKSFAALYNLLCQSYSYTLHKSMLSLNRDTGRKCLLNIENCNALCISTKRRTKDNTDIEAINYLKECFS